MTQVTSYRDTSPLKAEEDFRHEGSGLVKLVSKLDHDVIMTLSEILKGCHFTHLTARKATKRTSATMTTPPGQSNST
jgi:hypothetical protein